MLLLLLLLLSFASANWTRVFQTTPAGARYGSRAAYCQIADSMVLVDDLCDGIFRFDFTTMQWTTIQLVEGSIKPSARSYFTFTKVSETPNACWNVMTSGKRIVPINVNHAWLLQIFPANNTAQWFVINITSATRPEVRISSNAVSLHENTIHLFGGSVQSTSSFNDLWEFTLNPERENVTYTGSWRQLLPHTASAAAVVWPLPRHAHAMAALDSNSFAVYGGRRYITPQEMNTLGVDLNYVFLDEVAVYTVDTGVWRIVPSSKIQRSSHAMFYSQQDHRMYSFGGYRRGKYSTFQSNDVLMSATRLSSTAPCFESNATTTDNKVGGVWCNASDGGGNRPGPRFEFASIQRGNTFVVCGGLSLVNGEQSSLQDIWMYNMSNAVSLGFAFPRPDTAEMDGEDSFYTGAMYYMIAVLVLVLACGLVTLGAMKRRFRLHRQLQEQQQRQQQQENFPPLPGQVGVSEEDIKRLPTRVYEKRVVDVEAPQADQGEGDDTSEACAICLDDYQTGHELRDLPCVHSFHVECVDQWLGKHNVCPMCKRVVGGAATAPPTETSSDGVPSPLPSPLPPPQQEEEEQHHGHSHSAANVHTTTLTNV